MLPGRPDACAPAAARPFIVGISGASCSGKTTLARRLTAALQAPPPAASTASPSSSPPSPVSVCATISADSYYRGLAPGEDAATRNWDDPSSLDLPLLAAHLAELRRGGGVDVPGYDFAAHARTAAAAARVAPGTPIVLVDGLFVLADAAVAAQCDLHIYCAADADVCLARRLQRDVAERGRSTESVLEQYTRFVRGGVRDIIAPSAARADIVIPSDGPSAAAVDVIAQALQRRVDAAAAAASAATAAAAQLAVS